MDLLIRLKSIDLTVKFLRGELDKIGAYEYTPQKNEIITDSRGNDMPWSTPEAEGVPSGYLMKFISALEDSPSAQPQSIHLMRHGKIIAEGYWKPYLAEYPKMVYSMSKSVAATAIGMLIDEGELTLDEHVSDILQEKKQQDGRFFPT